MHHVDHKLPGALLPGPPDSLTVYSTLRSFCHLSCVNYPGKTGSGGAKAVDGQLSHQESVGDQRKAAQYLRTELQNEQKMEPPLMIA